jgi:uncharacterized protein (TIGR03437 family)
MFRLLFAFGFIASICGAQTFPAFRWVQEVDGSGQDQFAGMATDAVGNVYVVGSTASPNFPVKNALQSQLKAVPQPGYIASNCFVVKLDPAGNVVYSTYFGSSGSDAASAMTVDAAGNVYVTGTTSSVNFPTTKGAYATTTQQAGNSGNSFLFKLNADGSLAFSTYFAPYIVANTIATGTDGSVYIAGGSYGGVPTTPGAYKTTYCCAEPFSEFEMYSSDAFVARFNASGTALIYSTYLGVAQLAASAVAIGADGSAYVVGIPAAIPVPVLPGGVYRLNAAGTALLASNKALAGANALALAPDGSVYLAGSMSFQATTGAFQTMPYPVPNLQDLNFVPDGIVHVDAQLQNILAGTYFNNSNGENTIGSLALDAQGNVYAGGSTSLGLPTRTPMYVGFGAGFLSEFSGDLSTLEFSSYFGADQGFGVKSVAPGANGNVLLGGAEVLSSGSYRPGNIWLNSLTLLSLPALRIDSVVNAASLVDGPVSGGETIQIRGAGFGSDAQVTLGGAPLVPLAVTPTQITATVPAGIPIIATAVVVSSGGASSNQVLIPVTLTAPGLFSANGAGYGQGYILNKDGTLNTPSNPASPGDRITIYATGVGLVSSTGGYAVSQFPSNLFIDTVYCDGVAARMGPVAGFPGDVYQLTVFVPSAGTNYRVPLHDQVILTMNGVSSQNGIAISIAQ